MNPMGVIGLGVWLTLGFLGFANYFFYDAMGELFPEGQSARAVQIGISAAMQAIGGLIALVHDQPEVAKQLGAQLTEWFKEQKLH
jgi:hypothetical protein